MQNYRKTSHTTYDCKYHIDKLQAQDWHKDVLQHGQWRYYDIDSSLYASGSYVNDEYNGEWIWYYPNGNVQ